MANEAQLAILKQGIEVWNKWRYDNSGIEIDLSAADLSRTALRGAFFGDADISRAKFDRADLRGTVLTRADLRNAYLVDVNLTGSYLDGANLSNAVLIGTDLSEASLIETLLMQVVIGGTIFGNVDFSQVLDLESVIQAGPSRISTDTFVRSKGKIPAAFLRGCGLSDWEIEAVKLYNPDLSNEERNKVLYRIYDLQVRQAIQVSHLFISYSHADSTFVDKLGKYLQDQGIRYWRDTHEMKAGRIEAQIDRGIRQNPLVLLILSEHSVKSDWVQHEVRTARDLEQETGRDVLCPVALDKNWGDNTWPKRIMEQVMEYKVLDFSAWQDDSRFDDTFHKLIDGLELFYKG